LQTGFGADPSQEMIEFTDQRLMELEVETLTGHPWRTKS
jgi:hypothetical protein